MRASAARERRRENNAVTCSPSSKACRRWPVGLKSAAQRHNGDGGGESQSKRQELTFEFCSALAEVMQLSTDALAQVGTSAESTCHTPHATRHTSHVTRHTSHATRHTPHAKNPTCWHPRSKPPTCSSPLRPQPRPATTAALNHGCAASARAPVSTKRFNTQNR